MNPKAKPPKAPKGKAAKAAEPSRRTVEASAPDKRRRQNITTHGKHKPPQLVDPTFLSEAERAKREIFAQAFVAKGTLAEAAKAAGYTGKVESLRKAGWLLYHEPAVQARIEVIKADLLAELKIDQRAVLAELARVGFADMGTAVDQDDKILPLSQMPLDTRRALSKYKQTRRFISNGDAAPIEEIETEVTFEGKLPALDKLAKHTGLLGKKDDDGPGLAADEFIKALAEGIARASQRHRP